MNDAKKARSEARGGENCFGVKEKARNLNGICLNFNTGVAGYITFSDLYKGRTISFRISEPMIVITISRFILNSFCLRFL